MRDSLIGKVVAGTAGIVVLATGVPVGAGPRVTARMEQESLHGVLRRLREHYGRSFVGPRGEGGEAYRDEAATVRHSFDWKDASLGSVVREVAQAYRLTPRMEKAGDIRFLAGAVVPTGRTQRGELLSATLHRIDQDETRTQVSGVARPAVERSLTLHLTLRTLGADAERIHSISHAVAADDRERKWDLLELPRAAEPPATEADLPDERSVRLRTTGLPEGMRQLARVEGTVLLFRSLATYRFEVPLGTREAPPVLTQGPIQFRPAHLEVGERRISAAATLGWPEGVEVLLPDLGTSPTPVCRARLRDGRLFPLEARALQIAGIEGVPNAARLTIAPTLLPEEPTALVWDLTARSRPDLEVPFRFEAVPLPLGGADPLIPARGTSNLLIRLGRSISLQEGELAVGLSQRGASGWGPYRWRTVEVTPGAPARIDGLAPGSYRVSVRFRRRGSDGRLQPALTLPGVSATPILLSPNRETAFQTAP